MKTLRKILKRGDSSLGNGTINRPHGITVVSGTWWKSMGEGCNFRLLPPVSPPPQVEQEKAQVNRMCNDDGGVTGALTSSTRGKEQGRVWVRLVS